MNNKNIKQINLSYETSYFLERIFFSIFFLSFFFILIGKIKYFFYLLLLENGDLYGFGSNSEGQIGKGDNLDKTTPTLIMKDVLFFSKIFCFHQNNKKIIEDGNVVK